MNDSDRLRAVRARTRRRMVFSLLVLTLYFSFVLNWTEAGAFLARPLGGTQITGSLVMFVTLILLFIGLELVFLWFYRRERSGDA